MEIPMSIIYCAECHLPFAIPAELDNQLRECHSNFKCPLGHGNIYLAETEKEKLTKELSHVRSEKVNLDGERAMLALKLKRAEQKLKLQERSSKKGETK